MRKRLKHLVASTAKELTVCYRDPDVFIYSILLPALIYPLMLFFGSEFLLWRSGAAAHMTVRVALAKPETNVVLACRERLKTAGFSIGSEEGQDATKLLQEGRVDAVVAGDGPNSLAVSIKGSSASAADVKEKLDAFFRRWQAQTLVQMVAEQKRDKSFLQAFSVNAKDLAPSTAIGKSPKDVGAPLGSIRMVLCTMLCLACSSIAYGAMAPVVCLFTEEREKNTLPTTLLLPVNRATIVTAKLLATSIVALVAGLANLVNLALVGIVLLAETKILQTMNLGIVFAETLPLLNCTVLICLLIGLSITVASVMATAATCARDYSQAYNLLSVPLLWASILPLLGALPVLHHLEFTAWLPIANLAYQMADVLNKDVRGVPFVITLIESLILNVFCICFIKHVISSEKIFSGPAS